MNRSQSMSHVPSVWMLRTVPWNQYLAMLGPLLDAMKRALTRMPTERVGLSGGVTPCGVVGKQQKIP